MDVVLAPGAHAALRGRAGVRCAALGSGTLRVGPATVTVPDGDDLLDASRAGLPRRRLAHRRSSAAIAAERASRYRTRTTVGSVSTTGP